MQNKRLSYIDIAKGILILMVVWDHLPDVYIYILKQTNIHIEWLNETQWIFKIFFMPAFFCITGFCSNFNKDFKSFFISNAKTLLIPNILLGMITNRSFALGAIILHGGNYWFLSALFVAKMIYFPLNRFFSDIFLIRLFMLLVLVFIGFSLNGIPTNYDVWYFHYAFNLAIFLELGKQLRQKGNMQIFSIASILYLIICLTLSILDIHKPVVALGTNCKVYEIPFYLLSASTGSCLILWISRKIESCKVLEYFGSESLIFYIFQVIVMQVLEKIYIAHFEILGWPSVIFFVLVISIITIIVLSVISRILETRYLKFVLGKF